MLAIEAIGLRKRYGGLFARPREALAGLDLAVPEGGSFALLGRSGAGKSTLAKILLGLSRPSAGTARALGGDPTIASARARVGYLPERLAIPRASSPLDFLAYVARLKGMEPDRAALVAELARVGLRADADRRIGGLMARERGAVRRLGLASALLGRPALLVLDEPEEGLDAEGAAWVRRAIADERDRGAAILIAARRFGEVARACDRVGVLRQGRLARAWDRGAIAEGADRWRVRFAPGVSGDALARIGFARGPRPDEFVCEVEGLAALDALLDRARAAGALLAELARDGRAIDAAIAEALRAEAEA